MPNQVKTTSAPLRSITQTLMCDVHARPVNLFFFGNSRPVNLREPAPTADIHCFRRTEQGNGSGRRGDYMPMPAEAEAVGVQRRA
jgi:hypothetical protein